MQAVERRELLQALTPLSPFTPVLNIVLVPEVHCSSMARLGNLLDGGKWVCNPQYLPTDHCVVYAVGLNNEVSFEEALQNFTQNGCALRAIDK
ncbi:Protein Y39F10A.3, partial [Aphelenchoides avenae]